MIAFLRIRRTVPAVLAALASCAGLILLGSAPMTIFAGMVAVPWAFVVPPILAACALVLSSTPFPDWEQSARRNVRARDVAIRTAFVLGASSLAAVCVLLREPAAGELAVQVGRNAIGIAGMGLILAGVAGMAMGGVAPLCYSIVAILGGRDESDSPHWWAWILAGGDELPAWLLALGLGCVGMVHPLVKPVGSAAA